MVVSASIGAFGIVLINTKIVLVRHAYGDKKLSLPGGGLGVGETPDITVHREVFEETNLCINFQHIGTYFLHKSPGCVYLFYGEAKALHGDPMDSQEISEIILADPNNLPTDIYPAQRKLIERWKNGKLNMGDSLFDLL